MKLVPTLAAAAMAAATLTACGGHSKAATTQPTGPVALSSSAAVSPSTSSTNKPPKTSKSPVVTATGAPTDLDPCKLVTQQEASQLTGAAYGPGKEEASANKARRTCVYGAQTPNVLMVFVVQAASEADATTGWNELLAEAQQSAGQAAQFIQLTAATGIGDRAEWAELNLASIHVQARGLAFQKGTTGIYIIDEARDGTPPSRDALTSQAQTVLGRI